LVLGVEAIDAMPAVKAALDPQNISIPENPAGGVGLLLTKT
jgi:hypothetical protein